MDRDSAFHGDTRAGLRDEVGIRGADMCGPLGCPERGGLRQSPPDSLFEHFFDLPDLFFNFAGDVFGLAFIP